MATQVQLRRGTAAENNAFTGAQGEVTVDTTNDTLRVHDGSQAGGYEVITADASGNIDVTGTVTADGLTVDGASVFNQAASDQSGGAAIKANGTAYGTNKSIHAYMDTTNDAKSLIFAENGSSSGAVFNVAGNGDISFYEDTGTTPKLFWDASAERLGIGTSSPAFPLEIGNGTASTVYAQLKSTNTGVTALMFGDNDANDRGRVEYSNFDNSLRFKTNGTNERMRIDSSGHLLVGQSSSTHPANDNTIGMAIRGDGLLSITRDQDPAAHFNRKGNDGQVVVFRKDDTVVGAIGTYSGYISVGSGDVYVLYNSTANALLPASTATAGTSDGAIDLASSSRRFKDLYLSGGVYLGGTGAANYLDDYEEGTWTPVITGSTTAGTVGYDNQIGKYTKIGNIVTVSCVADTGVVTVAPTGDLRVSGLPFNPGSGNEFVGAVVIKGIPFPASTTTVSVTTITSQSYVEFQASGDNVAAARVQADNLATDDFIYFTLTYRV